MRSDVLIQSDPNGFWVSKRTASSLKTYCLTARVGPSRSISSWKKARYFEYDLVHSPSVRRSRLSSQSD